MRVSGVNGVSFECLSVCLCVSVCLCLLMWLTCALPPVFPVIRFYHKTG